MAKIEQIYAPRSPSNCPHVIFVHGLGGHIRETWMHNRSDPSSLWPRWVGEDCDCAVWILGYDAAMSGWTDEAMQLSAQTQNILDLLVSEPGLKTASFVMIGHSMGGLMIKKMVVAAMTTGVPRYEELISRLKGVVFVGTPHFGSSFATLGNALKMFRTNEHVGEMAAHKAGLSELNTQFLKLHRRLEIAMRVFSETRGILGRRFFGLFPGPLVVNSTSSDPHFEGEIAVPLPEDHSSICKPKNTNAQIHKSVLHFLSEIKDRQTHDQAKEAKLTRAPEQNHDAGVAESTLIDRAPSIHSSQRPTELSFAGVGLIDPDVKFIVSTCLVTDEAKHLAGEIENIKQQMSRDLMLPSAIKQRSSGASLVALLDEAILRPKLLDWLSVVSFSAYVYYADRDQLPEGFNDAIRRRFLVEPLIHRVSKKSELIMFASSGHADFVASLEEAVQTVYEKFGRKPEPPQVLALGDRRGRSLIELTELVAAITSRHLESPNDEDVTSMFEHVRTRIRFAENIVNGEIHTRDRNPIA